MEPKPITVMEATRANACDDRVATTLLEQAEADAGPARPGAPVTGVPGALNS